MTDVDGEAANAGPGAIERFARGFSAPAVLLALVAGGVTGWITREPAGAAVPPPGPAAGGSKPTEPDPTEEPDEETPPEPVARLGREELERLIRVGELRQARQQAEASGHDDLAERAALLLALSENIVLGSWGQAETALRCGLRGGKVVLGTPLSEAGDTLELEAWDGERQAIPRPTIEERKTLRGAEKARALSEALAQARDGLGSDPSGLSIHRLAFLAFRGGDRPNGVRFLVEALASRDGRILVDIHGSGDFALLHRAREGLASERPGGDPPPTPRPPPPPTPRPEPAPVRPEPEPEPEPPTAGGDALTRDPDWRRVEALYREGIGLYRDAFGSSIREGAPQVKKALTRFQQAQELLERLLDRHPGDGQVEQRMIEVNSLVIDCHKRLGTD